MKSRTLLLYLTGACVLAMKDVLAAGSSRRDPLAAISVNVHTAYLGEDLDLFASPSSTFIGVPATKKTAADLLLFYPRLEATGDADSNEDARVSTGCYDDNQLQAYDAALAAFRSKAGPLAEDTPIALLVARGGCTFQSKADTAKYLGAAALLVFEVEDNFYSVPNPNDEPSPGISTLKNPCSIDCSLGRDSVQENCESISLCASNICLENERNSVPSADATEQSTFCCARDDLLFMNLSAVKQGEDAKLKTYRFPAIFLSIVSGRQLRAYLDQYETDTEVVSVKLFSREVSTLGNMMSLFVMWFFAVAVASSASWFACREERQLFMQERQAYLSEQDPLLSAQQRKVEADSKDQPRPAQEEVDLDAKGILAFFVMTSIMLLFIFFVVSHYPTEFVILMIYFYAVSVVHPVGTVVFIPITRLFCRKRSEKVRHYLAYGLAISFSLYYVLFRHDSVWVWLFQDVMAISLTCTILKTIKVNRVQIGFQLLLVFFAYDVFMTFLTPLFFHGKSVMVEVATAGNTEIETVHRVDHELVCDRTLPERMPMLFLIPNSFDAFDPGFLRRGEVFSFLGLGDVFLPSLLLVYALKLDYLKLRLRQQEVRSALSMREFYAGRQYYQSAVFGYGAGFCLTLLANYFQFSLFHVQGQPALLYLVPCVLLSFRYRAKQNSEFDYLWSVSLDEVGKKMDEADEEDGTPSSHDS